MRELTKSLVSFSMAMPLFGLQQMARIVSQPDVRKSPQQATDALQAVSSTAQRELGGTLYQVFALGDRWQRRAVDLAFSLVPGSQIGGGGPSLPGLPWSSSPSHEHHDEASGAEPAEPAHSAPTEPSHGHQPGWGPMPSKGGP